VNSDRTGLLQKELMSCGDRGSQIHL